MAFPCMMLPVKRRTGRYNLYELMIIMAFLWGWMQCHDHGNLAMASDSSTISASNMHPSEKQAFYNVLESLNSQVNWRFLYPDPCGVNSLQGTACDEWDGYYYFTILSFGPLYDNSPSCSENASLHNDISKLAHLKSLSFYKCFSNTDETISPSLGNLGHSLESLTFRYNNALKGGIPIELGNLSMLKRLIITENNIEGPIPGEITNISTLLQLDLSWNRLQGGLPPSLGHLQSLVVLDLSGNLLNGSIPAAIGALNHLQKIDLSRNSLQGPIPDAWANVKLLRFLDLSYNSLQESLPQSLFQLVNLQELYIKGNSFNRPFPPYSWNNLSRLMSLDLSSCGFRGTIPAQLGTLRNLRFINLRNNSLIGSIPIDLANLSQLYALYVDDNSLSGHVSFPPDFLRQLGPNLHLGGNPGLCVKASFQWHADTWPDGVTCCATASSSVPQRQPWLVSTLITTAAVIFFTGIRFEV